VFNFKPAQKEKKIPFFDDVKASDGWEGHTTSKSIDKLQSEISTNLSLIGCVFSGCIAGTYGDRHGFQIHFAMKDGSGRMIPSRLDISCLPLNPKYRHRSRSYGRGSKDPRIEGTQKMALYMCAKAIKGMYFLNVLSPSFIPFMSLMLNAQNETLGQVWIQSGGLAALMPPKDAKFQSGVVDGEVV